MQAGKHTVVEEITLHIVGRSLLISRSSCAFLGDIGFHKYASLGDIGFHELQDPRVFTIHPP